MYIIIFYGDMENNKVPWAPGKNTTKLLSRIFEFSSGAYQSKSTTWHKSATV
jgi:hypothetical protein